MGEVIRLKTPPVASHEPDDILEVAKGQPFKDVVVIGLKEDGNAWISASTSDAERVTFMMNLALRSFMDIVLGTGGR